MVQGLTIDVEGIAVGCLYLLAGQATVVFPTSTKAHPSWEVIVDLVSRHRLFRETDRKLFPFSVKWDLWEYGVTPLLKDRDLNAKVSNNRGFLYGGGALYQALLAEVTHGLRVSMKAAGFIPEETVQIPISGDPTGFGEPLRAEVELPVYQTYDE